MDLRTGKIYYSVDDALDDGVPESDIAHVEVRPDSHAEAMEFKEHLKALFREVSFSHSHRIRKDFQKVKM